MLCVSVVVLRISDFRFQKSNFIRRRSGNSFKMSKIRDEMKQVQEISAFALDLILKCPCSVQV